ncbi:MAG: glycosyltransferase family 2 protein [Brevinema sp.]
MNPKLSVIIPVYNVEKYLKECIDSIINQTYKNIEIIIVNDASPDNSEQIIREYENKDSRIVSIKHTHNLGLGGARNTGITYAKGEWIYFIDSDDWLDLNCFENMIKLLEQNPHANLAIHSVILIDDNTKKKTVKPYFNIQDFSEKKWFWYQSVISCAKFFRIHDIKDKEIFFPLHLKHEDEEFWVKYCLSVDIIPVGAPSYYYYYRRHDNSITVDYNSRKDFSKIAQNVYNFAEERGLLNTFKDYLCYFFNKVSDTQKMDNKFIVTYFIELKQVLDQLQLTENELSQYSSFFQHLYLLKDISYINFFVNKIYPYLLDNTHSFKELSLKYKLRIVFVELSKKFYLYKIMKYLYKMILSLFRK